MEHSGKFVRRRSADPLAVNLALLAVTLALIAGGFEAVLRAGDLYKEGGIRPVDPLLVYELVPGARLSLQNAEINSQGLADRVYDLEKKPGVFRIAVVGDSTSFPHKIAREEAYPEQLEKMLNEREPGRYEVINFSVPGYNTAQEYELIRRKVVTFSPDLVLLAFCNNDIGIPFWFHPRVTPLNFLFHRTAAFHWLVRRIDLYAAEKNRDERFGRFWKAFKKNVLAMEYPDMRIYKAPGLEVAPAEPHTGYTPWKDNVPARYAHMTGVTNYARYLSLIRDFLAERRIRFISAGYWSEQFAEGHRIAGIEPLHLSEFLKREKEILLSQGLPEKDFSIPGDGHLNAEGHAVVAKGLFRYFSSEVLPGLSGAGTPAARTV